MPKNNCVVVCKLPKAGLGNQLFPLMQAAVFAHLNHLELIVIGYHRLKLGPYLRKEKNKRKYQGFFIFQKSILGEGMDKLRVKKMLKNWSVVYEPEVKPLPEVSKNYTLYWFEKMTTYHDYFKHLKAYRGLVIELLFSLLDPLVLQKYNAEKTNYISLHIRMGDFRKLNEGEKYNSGHVRAPLEFFNETLNGIRKIRNDKFPAIVFSDGYKAELADILTQPNVKLSELDSDLLELLLLSKGKIIIGTHGSTFSAWAAFLSNSIYISYFDYPTTFRSTGESENYYEGKFDIQNEFLIKSIQSI